jgi:hypothetical protein
MFRWFEDRTKAEPIQSAGRMHDLQNVDKLEETSRVCCSVELVFCAGAMVGTGKKAL